MDSHGSSTNSIEAVLLGDTSPRTSTEDKEAINALMAELMGSTSSSGGQAQPGGTPTPTRGAPPPPAHPAAASTPQFRGASTQPALRPPSAYGSQFPQPPSAMIELARRTFAAAPPPSAVVAPAMQVKSTPQQPSQPQQIKPPQAAPTPIPQAQPPASAPTTAPPSQFSQLLERLGKSDLNKANAFVDLVKNFNTGKIDVKQFIHGTTGLLGKEWASNLIQHGIAERKIRAITPTSTQQPAPSSMPAQGSSRTVVAPPGPAQPSLHPARAMHPAPPSMHPQPSHPATTGLSSRPGAQPVSMTPSRTQVPTVYPTPPGMSVPGAFAPKPTPQLQPQPSQIKPPTTIPTPGVKTEPITGAPLGPPTAKKTVINVDQDSSDLIPLDHKQSVKELIDVAALAGVDVKAESALILEDIKTGVPQPEMDLIFQMDVLRYKMKQIAAENGLRIEDRVFTYLNYAAEEYLRNILEQVTRNSQHRGELMREDFPYQFTSPQPIERKRPSTTLTWNAGLLPKKQRLGMTVVTRSDFAVLPNLKINPKRLWM